MSFRRGDVVLVLFPDSNLRTSKRRPALVVQADALDGGLPQTIVAMVTVKASVDGFGHYGPQSPLSTTRKLIEVRQDVFSKEQHPTLRKTFETRDPALHRT